MTDIIMPPSIRPKGWGRRNPHCGDYTRKRGNKTNDKTALAISNGFDKISLFFTGRKAVKKPSLVSSNNPFANVINKLLNFNKEVK